MALSEKNQQRCNQLFEIGLKWNGTAYVGTEDPIKDFYVPHIDILCTEDYKWERILRELTREKQLRLGYKECALCRDLCPTVVEKHGCEVCPDCEDAATIGTEPISSYGSLMTFEEFKSCCKAGGFVDYDGFGRWATDKLEQCGTLVQEVRPSKVMGGQEPPEGFTHVVWYNR